MKLAITSLLLASASALAPAPKKFAAPKKFDLKLKPAVAALSTAALPVAAALAADDYQYGAVAAPGWILPAGAVLAIATAGLVPLALQSGDDAQKQMAEDAKDSWGKSNQDTLNKRR